jgi:hypothetical protein
MGRTNILATVAHDASVGVQDPLPGKLFQPRYAVPTFDQPAGWPEGAHGEIDRSEEQVDVLAPWEVGKKEEDEAKS